MLGQLAFPRRARRSGPVATATTPAASRSPSRTRTARLVESRAAKLVRKVLLRDVCLRARHARTDTPRCTPVPSSAASARCGCAAARPPRVFARRLERRAQAPPSSCSTSAPSRGRSIISRQRQISLRRAQHVIRVTRRDGELERLRIGEPDVLRRHRDRAAEDRSSDRRRPRSCAPSSTARPADRCRADDLWNALSMLKSLRRPCRSARSEAASRRARRSTVMCPPSPDVLGRRLEHRQRAPRVAVGLASRCSSSASSSTVELAARQARARRRASARSQQRRECRPAASGCSTNTRDAREQRAVDLEATDSPSSRR